MPPPLNNAMSFAIAYVFVRTISMHLHCVYPIVVEYAIVRCLPSRSVSIIWLFKF